MQFLDQNIERFRDAGLGWVLTLHDRLVHPGTPGNVVRFYGQHFLERKSGTISFQRPDFHFPKPLAAKLRLPAEGLLGDQGVGPDRPGVDLVIHEMTQLEHVNHTHGEGVVELPSGTSVKQLGLSVGGKIGSGQLLLDFVHGDDSKNRRRHLYPSREAAHPRWVSRI